MKFFTTLLFSHLNSGEFCFRFWNDIRNLIFWGRILIALYLLFCVLVVGHGGSDGLHGFVPSLDHVVADTVNSVYIYSLRF